MAGGGQADKGTTVRYEVFEAGAVFPSASVNRQALRVALTPGVPLSRGAGEPEGRERGIMECGSEASAHAEANASALQTGQRTVPLSHDVGEGLGVRAESGRTLPTANPSDVPLSGGDKTRSAWRRRRFHCPAKCNGASARGQQLTPSGSGGICRSVPYRADREYTEQANRCAPSPTAYAEMARSKEC